MISSAAPQEFASEHAFLSDVFHELSQPLTALQCLLELSLLRDTTAAELRASVEKALDNADRLRQRLVLMRAVHSADQPSFADHTTDLNDVLRELHEDLLPVFASAGQELRIERFPGAVLVRSDRRQLAGALFYCLEYLLRYSSAESATAVDVLTSGEHSAEIRIRSQASMPVSMSSSETREINSFELELARRTFRAVGGDFSVTQNDGNGCLCRGILHLA